MGYRVREYAPVGDLLPGMAYLVRRLLENTSNESWLRGKFADGKTYAELMKDPALNLKTVIPTNGNKLFYNEPLLDFAVQSNREQLKIALKNFRQKMPYEVKPIIENKMITCSEKFVRVNPSLKNEVVANIDMATKELAEKAMSSAKKALNNWKKTTSHERAAILEKAADIMLRDRFKLMATQIMEVGKPWAEADGDITEAIDFLRYYATHQRELSAPFKVGHASGETSHYIYKPRGVCVVIAPWNFPLAILAGQVAAALVTGNTVVMKPAEQSSLVAFGLFEIFKEAGLAENILQFLPGHGEIVGDYLVKHNDTATIAFTGSKAVGLLIQKNAALIQPNQINVKKCIIEMGGKNPMIIDNDADLDEAVDAVLYSAVGFSGQKCSAASRIIILKDVFDKFAKRLVEAAQSITISTAENPSGYYGPVVDEEAYNRLLNEISINEKKHQLLFKSDVPQDGYFVPVSIFSNIKTTDEIAQKEFFGPIIALIKAENINEALAIANDSEYALTAGIFTRSPVNIEKAKIELEAGNIYINRGITGAMVDRHPFGGFKMSGIGSKTGGPDYLKQFTEPIVITENTIRRGFSPDIL